jgi:hypothetical protein
VIDLLDALIPANPSVTSMDDVRFTGNAAGFAAAQASLSGSGGVEIVYDTVAKQVYVDVDGNGLIDGVIDMIIKFDSPDAMNEADFGISSGNVFTANTPGFDTNNPADSYENTTTAFGQNDIVNALASQLPGSTIGSGGGGDWWGYDVLNVTTTITVPTDLGTLMDGYFDRLNLAGGGTSAPIIGPDQFVNLDIYIGNTGADFTTGTSAFAGYGVSLPNPPGTLIATYYVQTVNSANGEDVITLTNENDNAITRAGDDVVNVGGSGLFYGNVELGDGADELDVAAGADLGPVAA